MAQVTDFIGAQMGMLMVRNISPQAVGFVAEVNTDPERASELPDNALRRLFGLTAAEARLAAALGEGHALKDIQARTETSLHTLRNQLKQIFQKTDTHRQSELMRLIHASLNNRFMSPDA